MVVWIQMFPALAYVIEPGNVDLGTGMTTSGGAGVACAPLPSPLPLPGVCDRTSGTWPLNRLIETRATTIRTTTAMAGPT